MTHEGHEIKDIDFAVITVSDTRNENTDISGKNAIEMVEKAGHRVVLYEIVKDDIMAVRSVFSRALEKADVIFFTGGTGIASRDMTVEGIKSLLLREIPGFGELFRYRSFEEIGARAILSSACAGLVRKGENDEMVVVFCVPGSPGAVKTAMGIVLPAIGHIMWEARR